MKLTDLHRNKGLKIASKIKPYGVATTPPGGAAVIDKREQRRLDQAAGLVPFACKLNSELIKEVQALAQANNANLNDTVADLIKKGLGKA